MTDTTTRILEKIRDAPIIEEPFAHIVIADLLPADLYAAAVAAIPPTSEMVKVSYPGSGFGRNRGPGYRPYGYAHPHLRDVDGPLGEIRDALASDAFGRALLDKFTPAIPADKHPHFTDDAHDYTTVFDLQVDLPGYAIAPHADTPTKIVTFQHYLSPDATLAEHGTMLCTPKDQRGMRGRSRALQRAGRLIDLSQRVAPGLHRRLERSRAGETIGIGSQKGWLPWSWFDVAKTVPALPNHFLAFAPCDRSFHAVTMDTLAGERPVLRGFIRAGSSQHNWIRPFVR